MDIFWWQIRSCYFYSTHPTYAISYLFTLFFDFAYKSGNIEYKLFYVEFKVNRHGISHVRFWVNCLKLFKFTRGYSRVFFQVSQLATCPIVKIVYLVLSSTFLLKNCFSRVRKKEVISIDGWTYKNTIELSLENAYHNV